MKTILFLLFGALFVGCGGSSGTSQQESQQEQILEPSITARTQTIQPLEYNSSQVVGSSYFQFASDAPAYEDLLDYINGSSTKYLDSVLEGSAISFTISVPDDATLYGSVAKSQVPYIGVLFYPSQKDENYRATASLGGWVLPSQISQMESTKDTPPLFEEPTKKYPLILYSHGGGGNILNPLELNLFRDFASKGYIVAGLFHGDMRFLGYLNNQQSPEDIALRALSISKLIDFLQSSKYSNNIDFSHIAAVGTSYGGATAFTLLGAKPIDQTSSLGETLTGITVDSRINVGVGVVPFMGDENFPEVMGNLVTFFGYGSSGALGVTKPYLAITGTNDTVAVERYTIQALKKSKNAHLVSLEQESHNLTPHATNEAKTWTYYFLEKYLKGKNDFDSLKDVEGLPVDSYRELY